MLNDKRQSLRELSRTPAGNLRWSRKAFADGEYIRGIASGQESIRIGAQEPIRLADVSDCVISASFPWSPLVDGVEVLNLFVDRRCDFVEIDVLQTRDALLRQG